MNETAGTYTAGRAPAHTPPPPALGQLEVMNRLRTLRRQIEWEMIEDRLPGELDGMQAAILMDVCRALGLNAVQTQYVIGPAYYTLAWDRLPAGKGR